LKLLSSRRDLLKYALCYSAALPLWVPSMGSAQTGPPPLQGNKRPFAQVSPPYPAPITPMYTASGGITNLRRYKGKLILLNFWATWCPACLYELPTLDQLQQERGGEDFQVVTLNVDQGNKDAVDRYFNRLDLRNLPLLYDPSGRAPTAFKLHHGLPWTFIIDQEGMVQGYIMGLADWDSDAARRLLAYYQK
jgi:thiol-disulfide isomerase/thioredoxin